MKKLLLIVFNLQFAICNFCSAQFGIVDSTFGVNGIALVPIYNGHNASCRNLIPLPDGRIIATGIAHNGIYSEFALTRIFSNGTVDTSFGLQGIVSSQFNGAFNSYSSGSIRQPDGKIIVGGDCDLVTGSRFAVARYDSTGKLDSAFGTFGTASFGLGSGISHLGDAMALQSNGKIIVAGSIFNTNGLDFAVVRFNTNGEIDTTFGNMGAVVTSIVSGDDRCFAIAVQNDDKIVLVGNKNNWSEVIFALVRYNVDGTLDTSFGVGGIATHAIGTSDSDIGYSVVIQQPRNKIIIGGVTNISGSYDFALLRFDSTGVLDNSFGNAGVTLTDFSGSADYGIRLLLQSDGKILLAGYTNLSGGKFALARYNDNGIIDNTFGTSGKSTVSVLPSLHICHSIAKDINNKIVLGGQVSGSFSFVLVRFNSGLTVSIDEAVEPINSNLLIYPNPAGNNFILKSNSGLLSAGKNVELVISDINGRDIYAAQLISNELINVTVDFPSGIYIVQLRNEDKIETQKLIVQ